MGRGNRIGRWDKYGDRSKGNAKGLRHLPDFTGSGTPTSQSLLCKDQSREAKCVFEAKPGFLGSQVSLNPLPLSQGELSTPPRLPVSVEHPELLPLHLWDSPSVLWPEPATDALLCHSAVWPWVSVNGPFHTENSPYISFKTFYSIIYTFKIIICNCPSCHISPRAPAAESVVCWKPGGHGTRPGARGSISNQQPFAYPSHFPCFLGQEEVNRKPKAWEPFTFGSEV